MSRRCHPHRLLASACPPAPVGRHGFTLMEVLVAVLVMAIVLPVAMSGVSHAMTASHLAVRRTEAGRLAEGRLAWLLATGQWQTSAPQGEFEPAEWGQAAAAYRWRMAVTSWRDPTIKQLDVTVYWNQQGHEEHVTLTTLVPDVTQSDTAGGGATP